MDVYVVDSFTGSAFTGNPAGVVVLDAPAGTEWMQSVAAELKHSETAFVVTDGDPSAAKPLRWFTPTTEVELCGHATLATAHVLGGDQRFDTRSGELSCTSTGDGRVEMDFPAQHTGERDVPEEIGRGLPEVEIETAAGSDSDLLVKAASAAQVRNLRPDFEALAQVPARGVIVTAESDVVGVDFVSRFFGPRVGIPEDPVTGSAHCVLAPWWSARLGRTELVGEQASPRGGIVHTSLRGDRVGLTGQAVTVLRGQLLA